MSVQPTTLGIHSLLAGLPTASPATFEYEGREWQFYPIAHPPVALALEKFVAKFVMRKAELTRPDDDDKDPIAWSVYNATVTRAQQQLERGYYTPFTQGFNEVLFNNPEGNFGLFWECVRVMEPTWTKDHARKLVADKADKTAMLDHFWETNFPKSEAAPAAAI